MGKVTIHEMKQHSPEWYEIRVGKLGASEAIGISTPSRMKTQVYKTLAEILTGEEEEYFISKVMQEGIDKEPDAIAEYEKQTFTSVRRVGYITNSEYEYLGLSPDGLVGDKGAIEVKCPLPKQHVMTIVTGEVPKSNQDQITQYFVVNEELDWVDFVSYNEKVKDAPMFIIRVTREEWKANIAKHIINYIKFEVMIKTGLETVNKINKHL